MLKIGLTGGIGSGKTTVANVFRALRVPVFEADEIAREMQEQDQNVRLQIRDAFGPGVFENDTRLDRKKLASIVFNDPQQLEKLNAIVHPAVGRAFAGFCEANKEHPYVIKEAAILFETGQEKMLDAMICVAAPEALRIERVMKRDQVMAAQVQARMQNQWPEAEKVKRSQFIVVNDEQEFVLPQVLKIHENLSGGQPVTN
ncbi:MAG TPA: dephospho-CoA kinase [Bacteroidia bacterium]|nr:dephospho-CoA kinase [Bacteroidia bacterium]